MHIYINADRAQLMDQRDVVSYRALGNGLLPSLP